jgi:hypothetical protein
MLANTWIRTLLADEKIKLEIHSTRGACEATTIMQDMIVRLIDNEITPLDKMPKFGVDNGFNVQFDVYVPRTTMRAAPRIVRVSAHKAQQGITLLINDTFE